MNEKSGLRRKPKPSGSTSSTPSAVMGVSVFCACRMWKISSCLRSAPGASMFSSFASLARARIFISFSSDRFIRWGALLARLGGARCEWEANGSGQDSSDPSSERQCVIVPGAWKIPPRAPKSSGRCCARRATGTTCSTRRRSRASPRSYVPAAPPLSDAEYDRLFRELEQLEAEHPDLITADSPTRRVGAAPSEKFAKVTHRRQMMSLANAMNEEEFLEFDGRVHRLLGDEPVRYVVEPKLD